MLFSVCLLKLISCVADVVGLCRVKGKVADRSNKTVNAKRNNRKEEVSKASGFETYGLKRGMVDYDATNPAKEESQKKAHKVVVVHNSSP